MTQGTPAQKASPAFDVPVHPDTASALGMALLEAGVPLSLLLDLAGLTRATSRDLARNEKADTSWVQRRLSA
jgi:hypothetical protein